MPRHQTSFALACATLLATVLALPAMAEHTAGDVRLAQFRDRDRDRDHRQPHNRDHGPQQGARALELIANARVNNRASNITFRLDPRQSHLSEIRFRSGDLSVLLETVEVTFADGSRQRTQLLNRVGPGEQSRPIEIDRRRSIREISVTKRPGFRPGETSLQLLARVEPPPPPPGPPPGNWSGVGQKIPPGWVMFGAQEASFRTEREVIRVGERFGRFDRIALRVLNNGLFLREITIVYGNGERDRKVVETSIPANSQTRPIDLRGDRFIREIEMVYRSERDRRSPAVIEVYGDIAGDWIANKDRHKHHGGWVVLGAERVSMFGKEREAIRINPRLGHIKALRFAAHRSDITFYSARVVYENGRTEDIALVRKLKDGQETQPIELKTRHQRIDRIELRYRSKLGLKGEGIVEIWGLT